MRLHAVSRAVIVIAVILAIIQSSPAADFIVTNVNDAGPGSLRLAILDASLSAGPDDIVVAAGVSGTITLTSTPLTVDSELVIHGPGANVLSVSGNDVRRVMTIVNAPVAIEDLTIRNGRVDGAGSIDGGAMTVSGVTLTLRRCVVRDSVASSSTTARGGAIALIGGGGLVLEDCLFTGNSANGGQLAFGGAIRQASGSFSARNCTFSGNVAAGGNESYGGGLSLGGSPLTLTHCTLTGNNVQMGLGRGAGLYIGTSTTTLRSVLNADNLGATDFGRSTGTYSSQGYNLDGDGGSLLPGGGTDLIGSEGSPIDPLLGSLANNGGPTFTHALLAGSPARDAGGDGAGLTTDQRSLPRVADGGIRGDCQADIGAFEVQGDCGCPHPAADSNCDGTVNFFDIDPFVLALFDPAAYQTLYCSGDPCAVDMDCSGLINFFDIDPFVACLFEACPPCP